MNWNETKMAAAASLRAAYLAEVERFAETLRPRFEAGELRGFRSGDGEMEFEHSPRNMLERLCAAHFGMETTEHPGKRPGWTSIDGDDQGAYLILAVSAFASAVEEAAQGTFYDHPAHHAVEAISWDVLAVATSRGWYQMTEDEEPSAEALAGRVAA